MKNAIRFGAVLALGGALAVAASGCGSAATGPTGGKGTPQPSGAARQGSTVSQEQSLAIATVRHYMQGMGSVAGITFTVAKGPKGQWNVTFHGAFEQTSKSAVAIFCGEPGVKPGQILPEFVYYSGTMLTSANGRSTGNNIWSPTLPTTANAPTYKVTCPLVKQAP